MNCLTRATAIVALAPLLMITVAYGADTKNQGYLTDRNGNIVTTRSGLCMRTREGTPNRADKQCKAAADGKLADNRTLK